MPQKVPQKVPHIRRRGDSFIFRFTVPEDAAKSLGQRYVERSLGTDCREAHIRAVGMWSEWRLRVLQVRSGRLPEATPAPHQRRTTRPARRSVQVAQPPATPVPATTGSSPPPPPLPSEAATPFTRHLEGFLSVWNVTPAVRDRSRGELTAMAKVFPTMGAATATAYARWRRTDKRRASTLTRLTSNLRMYWRYCVEEGHLPAGTGNPFDAKLTHRKADPNRHPKVARQPFTRQDVCTLLVRTVDPALAALVRLAAFTGARVTELCHLRIEDIGEEAGLPTLHLDSKTEAGDRVIPIHPELRTLLTGLRGDRTTGWLLPGLVANKYGDRSCTIPPAFSRLKRTLGFGPDKVFHSLRKTVATALENLGAPENVAADILGHEKKTMTYGLYSGGSGVVLMARYLYQITYAEVSA